MTLRPLLEIAAESDGFRALASAARAGEGSDVHMSPGVRPYLLAALVDSEVGLGGRPILIVTADDRSARDLARELGAYLAPRAVRYYPSRGTGYESHVVPPPHLVGLRIAALDALTGTEQDPVVVASAVALAEAVPDTELRPTALTIRRAAEIDLEWVSRRLVDAGYEHADQVEDRGQFAVRGGILDVFPATEERAARIELFGDEVESVRWFSTFTQRSLGDAERVELAPAAELAIEHRETAELVMAYAEEEGGDGERPDVTELLPIDRFEPPLDLLSDGTAVILAAADEVDSALSDHWDDVTTAMHADDARHLYVDVAEPLRRRAGVSISGVELGQELSFRAQRPTSPARTMSEAEGELERQLRSGYTVAVAFESRGEGERARYALDRQHPTLLEGEELPADVRAARSSSEPALLFCDAPLDEGFASPELKLSVIPHRRLVHRRRPAAPAPPGSS